MGWASADGRAVQLLLDHSQALPGWEFPFRALTSSCSKMSPLDAVTPRGAAIRADSRAETACCEIQPRSCTEGDWIWQVPVWADGGEKDAIGRWNGSISGFHVCARSKPREKTGSVAFQAHFELAFQTRVLHSVRHYQVPEVLSFGLCRPKEFCNASRILRSWHRCEQRRNC